MNISLGNSIENSYCKIEGISFAEGVAKGKAQRFPFLDTNPDRESDTVLLLRYDTDVQKLFDYLASGPNVVSAISDFASPISHLHWCLAYFGIRLMIVQSRFEEISNDIQLVLSHDDELVFLNEGVTDYANRSFGNIIGPDEFDIESIKFFAQLQRPEELTAIDRHKFSGIGEIKSELCTASNFGEWGFSINQFSHGENLDWQLPVRFFDYCVDKTQEHDLSTGPFGDRGIRLATASTNMWLEFLEQLSVEAPLQACAVLPMVNTSSEVLYLKSLANDFDIPIAAMIETPASVSLIEEIVDHVDYIFIGVNDLTQYSYAWDRMKYHPIFTPKNQLAASTYNQIDSVLRVCKKKELGVQLVVDMWPSDALVTQIKSLGNPALTIPPYWIDIWRSKFNQK